VIDPTTMQLVQLYTPQREFTPGAPMLRPCSHTDCGDGDDNCVETIICVCGEEHVVTATAYGRRAQCESDGVRWTSSTRDVEQIGRVTIMCWVAEPYDTMSARTTR
jgi:hypothetical protein